MVSSHWPTSTAWDYPVSPDLNDSNRPVRIRMPGGVAGAWEIPNSYADRLLGVVTQVADP
jgi:hypothetical protein